MNAQMHMAFIDFQAQGGYSDGMNLYQYLRSNPINLTDPNGEIAPFVAMLLGGAVAGAVGGGIAEIINNPDWTWGGVFGSAGKGALAGTAGAAAAVGAVAAAALLIFAGVYLWRKRTPTEGAEESEKEDL